MLLSNYGRLGFGSGRLTGDYVSSTSDSEDDTDNSNNSTTHAHVVNNVTWHTNIDHSAWGSHNMEWSKSRNIIYSTCLT